MERGGGDLVGRRVPGLSARLCGDDLQGPGQDPGPDLPLPHRALAGGGELCRTDRQRESAQVFVARETARDVAQLARQMAREEIKAASVAWATAES